MTTVQSLVLPIHLWFSRSHWMWETEWEGLYASCSVRDLGVFFNMALVKSSYWTFWPRSSFASRNSSRSEVISCCAWLLFSTTVKSQAVQRRIRMTCFSALYLCISFSLTFRIFCALLVASSKLTNSSSSSACRDVLSSALSQDWFYSSSGEVVWTKRDRSDERRL